MDCSKGKLAKLILAIIIAFVSGYIVKSLTHKPSAESLGEQTASQKWYCSMDPQIIRDGPGDCPICGMDLVPMPTELAVGGATDLVISEDAAKLMEITTSVVQRKYVINEIRMVGKIDYDETLVKYITAWVPGRIDRLYVDYTGITVNKGDHMVYLYSPQLLADQRSLLSAISMNNSANIEATKTRLRLLGLTDKQIADIEKAGEPVDHLTIYAPIGGVVIHKNATEGMYIETGTKIYTIADLSKLWVKLDAYESDMPWIRYGQEVEFTTEAYPGEFFKGTITFIDPVLNAKTRTVKVRVNIDNLDSKLKPEMFVRAVVHSKVASGGKVIDTALAGKWICPMHHEIIKDGPGECDICQMPLEKAEDIGFVKVDTSQDPPLVIPASAPLITGKRAVVYVKLPDTEKPTFQGREIVLGPKADDHYIVESGLAEGEIIVTNAAFKLDSALQIQAKPSMMSSQSESIRMEHVAAAEETILQKTCPVMKGGAIDKNVFTVYKGKKVYFCCPGCIDKFKANPEEYVTQLPQFKE